MTMLPQAVHNLVDKAVQAVLQVLGG
jgi:hypothetical protein